MSGVMNRMCAKCRRVIDLNDLSVNDGKSYHEYCLLQNIRSRIAFLSNKMGRKTATVLDGTELQDLLYIEERMKNDIETKKSIKLETDKPVFFGNTPLAMQTIINPPGWKKIIAKGGSLKGTKYHMHKVSKLPAPTTEPIWQITTDENGHKGVIQTGNRPVETIAKIDNTKKKALIE